MLIVSLLVTDIYLLQVYHLLVSCDNGVLLEYTLHLDRLAVLASTANGALVFDKLHELQLANDPAQCMTIVSTTDDAATAQSARREAWVGCGNAIVVVDLASWEVVATVDVKGPITALVSSGTRVWCTVKRCPYVLEVDVNSRVIVCSLNCRDVQLTADNIVSLVIYPEAVDASIESSIASSTDSAAAPQSTSPTFSSSLSNSGSGSGPQRSAASMSVLHKKLSALSRHRKNRPGVQNNDSRRPASRAVETYATSLCCVGDTLWIGRRSGDVAVVCVSDNNTYKYAYGDLVTVLRDQRPESSSTHYRVAALSDEGNRVIAILNSDSNIPGARIVVWKRWQLADYHQLTTWWTDITSATGST